MACVKIFSINANKSHLCSLEISRRLSLVDFGIVLLQEPGFKKSGKLAHMHNYQMVRFGTGTRSALVAKQLTLFPVAELSDKDCTVATFIFKGERICVTSIYADCNEPFPTSKIEKVSNFAKLRNFKLLIAADFNAWTPILGNDVTNSRGKELEDLIVRLNLNLLNDQKTPTFVNSRTQSFLDGVATCDKLFPHMMNWRVSTEPSFSDHRFLEVELCVNSTNDVEEEEISKSFYKCNWELFEAEMDKTQAHCLSLESPIDNEQEVNLLLSQMFEAVDKACPEYRKVKESFSWFDKKLKKLRTRIRKIYIKAAQKNIPLPNEYYRLLKEYRNKVFLAQEKHFQEMISKCEKERNINNIVKGKKHQNPIGLFRKENGFTQSPEEAMEFLLNKHLPGLSKTPKYTPAIFNHVNEKLMDYITVEKIMQVFMSFKDGKRAGPDGVRPEMLKHLPISVITRIQKIFKSSLTTGFLASQLRYMEVVWVPKPNKPNYDDYSSFRPITLASFLVKASEKISVQFTHENNPSTKYLPDQFGFTESRSTEDCISHLLDPIEESVFERKFACALFADVGNAFSTLNFRTMYDSFLEFGVSLAVARWILNIYQYRIIVFKYGNITIKRWTTTGLSMGLCSSTFTWNLSFHKVAIIAIRMATRAAMFCDDLGAVITGPLLEPCLDQLQVLITELVIAGKECNLEFNPHKTKIIIFTRKRYELPEPLMMNNVEIEYSETAKYLGLTLHHKLSWTPHIKQKVANAKRLLFAALKLAKHSWGLSPYRTWHLYRSVVRPMISYACVFWASKVSAGQLKLLNQVQRLALLAISGAAPSSPTAGMEAALNILPLDLHCRNLALRTWFRIQKESIWNGMDYKQRPAGHKARLSTKFDQMGVPNQTDFLLWKSQIAIDAQISRSNDGVFHLWTDGSKKDNNVGAAWVLTSGNFERDHGAYKLPGFATVFQAEVFAVFKAIEHLINNKIFIDITVHIDNHSTLTNLYNLNGSSRLVNECRNKIGEYLDSKKKIRFRYTPSHTSSSDTGNELADHYCKRAAFFDCDPLPVPVPACEIKKLFLNDINEEWNIRWQTNGIARQSKNFIPNVPCTNFQNMMKWKRTRLARNMNFITGHGLLRRHRYLQGAVNSPACRFCEAESEDPEHILLDCPRFELERIQVFGISEDNPLERLHHFTSSIKFIFKFEELEPP